MCKVISDLLSATFLDWVADTDFTAYMQDGQMAICQFVNHVVGREILHTLYSSHIRAHEVLYMLPAILDRESIIADLVLRNSSV